MPPVYRYIVEETREMEVTAESPADAIKQAQPYFDNSEGAALGDIVVTRLEASKRY